MIVKVFVEFYCGVCDIVYYIGMHGHQEAFDASWFEDEAPAGPPKLRHTEMNIPLCPICAEHAKEKDCQIPQITYQSEETT